MSKLESLPAEMYVGGKPFWEQLGGVAVSLLGESAGEFFDTRNGYRQRMREEGHFVTNVLGSITALEKQVPHLHAGELGTLVVIDAVKEYDHQGGDMTFEVPQIIDQLELETPAIYVPSNPMNQRLEKALLERGYAAVVEYSLRPSEVIVNAARKVTELRASALQAN
ncbi:MAG TPA: hypothetical protein VLF39_02900 [Candidatus Saccharimonadales bacterium]|nr:hypothetical protein [Candidatus Saccharimonadales bacterium]